MYMYMYMYVQYICANTWLYQRIFTTLDVVRFLHFPICVEYVFALSLHRLYLCIMITYNTKNTSSKITPTCPMFRS